MKSENLSSRSNSSKLVSSLRRQRPIVLWAGRVGHLFGYGAATRRYLEAFDGVDFDLVVFDLVQEKLIGPDSKAIVSVRINKDVTAIGFEPGRAVVVVVHDTPERSHQFRVAGSTRLISSTMFECDGLPAGWVRELLRCDETWVPSRFNRKTFRGAGVPGRRLRVIPIPANPALAGNAITPMRLAQANRFRFLTVASAWDRKDIGLVLRAYLSEFTAEDDATLVIKLPARFQEFGVHQFIQNAIFPDFAIDDPKLAHVLVLCGDVDDERMWSLFAACDAYVSNDRGKGWDLPAFEAMQLGLVTIGVEWGGNTAFMTPQNSILIPPQPAHVLTGESLIRNKRLYRGQSWATIEDTALAGVMRQVFSWPDEYEGIRQNARRVNEVFSGANVAKRIIARLDRLRPSDFRDNSPALVEFSKRPFPQPASPPSISADELPARHPELQPFNAARQPAGRWLEGRRKVWTRERVTPGATELARLQTLQNAYLGKRIFIVGNSFKARTIDFRLLDGEFTFGSDQIFKVCEKTGWSPTFYTILDWEKGRRLSEKVNGLKDSLFFFPQRFFGMLRSGKDVFWYEACPFGGSLLEQFETNLTNGIRGGTSTSTAAIQIAYFLGFREFYLIGHELDETARRPKGRDDDKRLSAGGRIDWPVEGRPARSAAQRRELNACRDAIAFHGGKIHNATPGGRLVGLPQVEFMSLFNGRRRTAGRGVR